MKKGFVCILVLTILVVTSFGNSFIYPSIKLVKGSDSKTTHQAVSIEIKLYPNAVKNRIEVKLIVDSKVSKGCSLLVFSMEGDFFACSLNGCDQTMKGKIIYSFDLTEDLKDDTRLSVFLDEEMYHLNLKEFAFKKELKNKK